MASPRVIRVGIVHGGPITTNHPEGAWGCDRECVENTTLCFQDDPRFSCSSIFIRDLRSASAIYGLDVLIMPGGDDEYDDVYGGPGQREALGDEGLKVIQEAIKKQGLLYVGTCAGAFLAANKGGKVVLAPSVTLFDEQNFGFASVRGWLHLEVLPSNFKDILAPWWKRNIYYDDGPALLVEPTDDKTQILATYKSKVRIDSSDRHRVQQSYYAVAKELKGKAAVTLTRRGKGTILLIGPHPEACAKATQKALVNLIAAITIDSADGGEMSQP